MSVKVNGEKSIFSIDVEIFNLFTDVLVLEVFVDHVVKERILNVLNNDSFAVSKFLESSFWFHQYNNREYCEWKYISIYRY